MIFGKSQVPAMNTQAPVSFAALFTSGSSGSATVPAFPSAPPTSSGAALPPALTNFNLVPIISRSSATQNLQVLASENSPSWPSSAPLQPSSAIGNPPGPQSQPLLAPANSSSTTTSSSSTQASAPQPSASGPLSSTINLQPPANNQAAGQAVHPLVGQRTDAVIETLADWVIEMTQVTSQRQGNDSSLERDASLIVE
ncbi:MAG: hypothetical protein MMC33_006908 [Icmadophila ericetorum]|nr:hypothetical protein [Icmadophila ericetorum]